MNGKEPLNKSKVRIRDGIIDKPYERLPTVSLEK